jgi:hypothetical protein
MIHGSGSGHWIQFRRDIIFREERQICFFSDEGGSTYFGAKMVLCCGGQIQVLITQLLDPVV